MSAADLRPIERALELSERLRRRGADVEADRLLGRAIEALGVELAKLDPVTAGMLELDAALSAHAAAKIADLGELEHVLVRRLERESTS